MRLRSGRITKTEVRNPIRRYVRRMTIPINNNGEQSSNSTRAVTIIVISTKPIPSSASTTAIPSMTVALSTLPDWTVLSPIPQSHPVTPRPIMVIEVKPFITSSIMPMMGHDQPDGMPTSMMENLQTHPVTFADNITNTYSSIFASGSAIGNHSRTMPPYMGMRYGSQAMLTFMTNSVMEMRQQMDESNHDMINTLT